MTDPTHTVEISRPFSRPGSAPAIRPGSIPQVSNLFTAVFDESTNPNTKSSPTNRSGASSPSSRRGAAQPTRDIFQPRNHGRPMTATTRRSSVYAMNPSHLTRNASLAKPTSPNWSGVQALNANSSDAGKLPHKFRRQVALLRSQVTFFSMARYAKKSMDARKVSDMSILEGGREDTSEDDDVSNSVTTDNESNGAAGTRVRYSRKSLEIQMLQNEIDEMRRKSSGGKSSGANSAPNAAASALLMDYYELLQPFVSAIDTEDSDLPSKDMSSRSLVGDPKSQSRVMRICVSLDNLLLSVVNRANEERTPQQIAHNSARNLMELLQHALKQLAVFLGEKIKTLPNQSSANNNNNNNEQLPGGLDGWDERQENSADNTTVSGSDAFLHLEPHQLQDLLVNLADRLGKLDAFMRQVYFEENDSMRKQMEHFIKENYELIQQNQQLSCEVKELRETQRFNTPTFHLNLSSALAASHQLHGSSKSLDLAGDEGSRSRDDGSCSDASFMKASSVQLEESSSENHHHKNHLFQLDAPRRQNEDPREEEDIGSLKKQRTELERLLEMAQEEIRLSHRDVQVQKERVAELSQTLFKDHEVQLLRGELMNEKRRVRLLEQENVTLREYHLEYQRFLAKQAAASAASAANAVATATTNQANSNTSGNSAANGLVGGGLHQISSLPVMLQPGLRSATLSAPGMMESLEEHAGRGCSATTAGNDTVESLSTNDSGEAVRIAQEPARPNRMWFYTLIRMDHHNVQEEVSLVRRSSAMDQLREALEQEKPQADHENAIKAAVGAPTIETPSVTTKVQVPSNSLQRNSTTRVCSSSVADASGEIGQLVYCRSLINVLYQRQLLVEEDRAVCCSSASMASIQCDPSSLFSYASGAPQSSSSVKESWCSFPQTVFCFFLERRRDSEEAEMDACRFMKTCHRLRHQYADIALFCDFVEETKSQHQLHLFLWLLQAIERLPQIGIKYPNAFAQADHFICFFKATYLTRAVFRLLRFQFRTKPPPKATSPKHSKHQQHVPASSPSPSASASTSASTMAAAASPSHTSRRASNSSKNTSSMQALENAMHLFRQEMEANHLAPVSLEVLHGILERFCEVPAHEELVQCNGMFYRPTGDERKVSLYVFAGLLLEVFACQRNWYKKQLQQVFVSLWHEQKATSASGAAAVGVGAATGNTNASTSAKKTPSSGGTKRNTKYAKLTPKAKSKSGRKRRHTVDSDAQQAVLGFSRNFLARFLSTIGVDLVCVDVDWFYVTMLHAAGKNSTELSFQDLFTLLERLDLLPFAKAHVVSITSDLLLIDETKQALVLQEMQRNWQLQSNMLRVLCLNDPNPHLRKRVTFLLSSIDKCFAPPAASSCSSSTSSSSSSSSINPGSSSTTSNGPARTSCALAMSCWSSSSSNALAPLVILERIRGFLVFAWRLVAKRSIETRLHQLESHRSDFAGSKLHVLPFEWCLSEVFFVSRALRGLSEMPAFPFELVPPMYATNSANGTTTAGPMGLHVSGMYQDLDSFYDVSRMHCIKHLLSHLSQGAVAVIEKHRVEVQHVLLRFAVILGHIFDCYATTSHFISKGLQLHQAQQLASDLQLVSYEFRADRIDRIFRYIALHSANVFDPCGEFTRQYQPHGQPSTRSRMSGIETGLDGVDGVEHVHVDDEVEEEEQEGEDNSTDLLDHLAQHHSDLKKSLGVGLREPCLGKCAFVEFLVFVALEKHRCEKNRTGDPPTPTGDPVTSLGKNRKDEYWLEGSATLMMPASDGIQRTDQAIKRTTTSNRTSAAPNVSNTLTAAEVQPDNGRCFSLARLFNKFCRDYLFNYRNVFQEGHEPSFHLRVANPLVARVLLEHRDFLRTVFFGYSKRADELDDNGAVDPDDRDFNEDQGASPGQPSSVESSGSAQSRLHLGKTKKNAMNFQEFLCFLEEFELIPPKQTDNADGNAGIQQERAELEAFAQEVFRHAMCIENEDWSQMEYSEFTSAIAALALFRNPNPFVTWHAKIQQFICGLLQVAHRKRFV